MDRAANKNCGRGQANEPGRSARPVSLAGGEAEECQERAGRLNENRHAAFARRRPRSSEVDGRFWIEILSEFAFMRERPSFGRSFSLKPAGGLTEQKKALEFRVRSSEMATLVINILIEIERGDRRA